MKTSDAIVGFELEAKKAGVPWRALLKTRAAAAGVTEGQFIERLTGTVLLRESARPSRPQSLQAAFERLGHSQHGARVAAGGRSALREASAPTTKHEDPNANFKGGNFERADYAYTPSDDPSTWQLLLTTTPGGKPDPDFVRAAAMAIDSSNESVETVAIPEDDLPGVLATLSKAWQAAIPNEALPAILTAEAAARRAAQRLERSGAGSGAALMAAINDTAGIVTGAVLDAFNEMERVVARDGDTVGAAETLRQTFIKICHSRQTATAGTSGSTTVKRT